MVVPTAGIVAVGTGLESLATGQDADAAVTTYSTGVVYAGVPYGDNTGGEDGAGVGG